MVEREDRQLSLPSRHASALLMRSAMITDSVVVVLPANLHQGYPALRGLCSLTTWIELLFAHGQRAPWPHLQPLHSVSGMSTKNGASSDAVLARLPKRNHLTRRLSSSIDKYEDDVTGILTDVPSPKTRRLNCPAQSEH